MSSETGWHPPKDLKKDNVLVVACNSHFFDGDYVSPVQLPDDWGCDINCEFTNDLSRMDEADALWFHGPTVTALPEKKSGQKWIVMSMESDVNYPFMKEPRVMELFDIHMTYRLDSDVPCMYPNWTQYGTFLDEPYSINSKNKNPSPILYAASHPVRYRDEYISQLMAYIDVDSVGKCLNNTKVEKLAAWKNGGFTDLLELIRCYKFYLAFENSHTTDYVTERVFQALVAGSVPIYSGAENIRDFLPDDNAVIDVRNFSGPEELAEYLKMLQSDDAAYQVHLDWKKKGYCDNFKRLVDLSSIEPLQRMFIKLAHGCDRDCRCGGRLR